MTIAYTDSFERKRRYTPDVLVEYDDGIQDLCEVKYRADIKQDWAALKPKFKAGRRFAQENGLRFRILTEVEIRGCALSNINFLRQYRDCVPDTQVRKHLLNTLALLRTTTPEELLRAAYWLEADQQQALAPLWQLLADNSISIDLSQPLTMKSTIWLTTREERLWLRPHLSHLP